MARVAIVGAGPAGTALAYLLARNGVEVVLLERQRDFAREFRGEVLMPSGADALRQMGLAELLARLPKAVPTAVEIWVDRVRRARFELDLSAFGDTPPAAVSQPALLESLVAEASRHASMRFERGATVRDLLRQGDRVVGVHADLAHGAEEIRADLVVGADGRSSVVRRRAAFRRLATAVPFDVVWCKLPLPPFFELDSPARGYLGGGHLLLCARSYDDRLQLGWVIVKGAFGDLRRQGIEHWVTELAQHVSGDLAAHLRASTGAITHPFLLDAVSDRVEEWSAPGVLVIGDAAHTMSPVGAQGLNVALRDAIVAANHLVPVLHGAPDADGIARACAAIQHERANEIETVQRLQAVGPRIVLNPAAWAAALRRLVPWIASTRVGRRLAARQAGVFAYGVDEVRLRV